MNANFVSSFLHLDLKDDGVEDDIQCFKKKDMKEAGRRKMLKDCCDMGRCTLFGQSGLFVLIKLLLDCGKYGHHLLLVYYQISSICFSLCYLH